MTSARDVAFSRKLPRMALVVHRLSGLADAADRHAGCGCRLDDHATPRLQLGMSRSASSSVMRSCTCGRRASTRPRGPAWTGRRSCRWEVGDVGFHERQEVMLAHRERNDVLDQDDLVVLLGEGLRSVGGSVCRPQNISAYMRAARPGVSAGPRGRGPRRRPGGSRARPPRSRIDGAGQSAAIVIVLGLGPMTSGRAIIHGATPR